MSSTFRRAAGTAACALAVTVTAAPLASAESQTHKDPRGDVVRQTLRASAPKEGIDIVSSTNQYKGNTLTMELTAANLVKDDFAAVWTIKVGDTDYGLQYFKIGGEAQAQFVELSPTMRINEVLRAPGVGCEGFTVSPAFKRDSIVGTVPRSCIANTDTVRVGAALIQLDTQGQKIDDARRTEFPAGATAPKLGPKLDRN